MLDYIVSDVVNRFASKCVQTENAPSTADPAAWLCSGVSPTSGPLLIQMQGDSLCIPLPHSPPLERRPDSLRWSEEPLDK